MRIFIVEDEALVAMMLEEALAELGHSVSASCAEFDDALRVAHAGEFDAAIVDINLRGRASFEVAQAVAARGIPVCFASGHGAGDIPPDYAAFRVLAKPYTLHEVERLLAQLAQP